MKSPICVITGGTSGIGLATAVELAAQGGHLVLIGRKVDRGDRAIGVIARRTPAASVEFMQADLSSMAGVHALAAALSARFPAIDVLVNNAGARFDRYAESADGIELTFATNHLGHFLLTNLLIGALERSGVGRVITVSSRAHWGAEGDGVWQEWHVVKRLSGIFPCAGFHEKRVSGR